MPGPGRALLHERARTTTPLTWLFSPCRVHSSAVIMARLALSHHLARGGANPNPATVVACLPR
ncbi:hypothetical protein [Streptomyces nigrescens]|uniref:hypothetical protein n=1 Tax=Streptomyces nigrescens TaxID=1920 RepID=UPI0036754B5B